MKDSKWTRAMISTALLLTLKFAISPTLVASAQQQNPNQPSIVTTTSSTSAKAPDGLYRIGPGDLLDIRVLNRPTLSREVRVDQSGMIRMPFIDGEIQAACRSEGELAREIATRLLKYQRYPQVDVFVKDYQSQPVAFIGSVRLPGRFQLQRRVRLLELMTYVGGPADNAGRTVQIIHTLTSRSICEEPAPGNDEVLTGMATYQLVDLMRGDEKANPYVRPGDIITLPEAAQAFVVGGVMRPGPIFLKEPTTVSKAVYMSGGVSPQGNKSRVRIVRQESATGSKTQLYVDLKAIDKGQGKDILLQAGDIVDIPGPSGFTKVLNTLTQSLLPSLTNLPLRVIP